MSILVNTGFKVGSAEPLNEYSIRETVDDRDALVTNGYVYEGMEVYCKDTKIKYRWTGVTWKEVGSGGGSGSGIASDVAYDNTALVDVDNVAEALDMIVSKVYYVAPSITSFTASPAGGTYEIGSAITAPITFNWNYNKDIVTQTLTDCTLADETVRTATYGIDITANKTFTLSVSDGTKTATKSISYSFLNKVYWGSATTGTYDSAFILALSNSKLSSTVKGTYSMTVNTGEYGFFAVPSTMSIPSVWIGGFEVTLDNLGTVSFTNSQGYTTNYTVYKTGQSGLGSINAEIK